MPKAPDEIRTDRLLLRRWRAGDCPPFAAMNADPRVMEFFPGVVSRQDSDAQIERIEKHFAEHGFGLWAVEVPGEAAFIGCIGLAVPRFEAHFTPCVEIGWRLAAEYWGRGYAPEGARAAAEFGFGHMGLGEIVAMTTPSNVRSRRVMEKIGMTYSPLDDFEHPLAPLDGWTRPHVLYRLRRPSRGG